jgi:hypothetical protein
MSSVVYMFPGDGVLVNTFGNWYRDVHDDSTIVILFVHVMKRHFQTIQRMEVRPKHRPNVRLGPLKAG